MKGFIIMTALPPTVGHKYLIDFAQRYCLHIGIRHLTVMVCGQPKEPLTAHVRAMCLKQHFNDAPRTGVTIEFLTYDKEMPDKPHEHPKFWELWTKAIQDTAAVWPGDIVFASEVYGMELAEHLQCEFVPCNIYREVKNITATKIRKDPIIYFSSILPEAQRLFRKTITVFGPESTGKTTLAKYLANMNEIGHYVPEWAREYLELQTDPTTTEERMQKIVYGQFAAQEAVFHMQDRPFIIQDTDLLSTAGFYEMYGWETLPAEKYLIHADHYLLLKDNVPFVADKLRYGVDKRERDYRWWERLLKEHKVSYTIIDGDTWAMREAQAVRDIVNVFLKEPLWSYRR